MTFEDFPPQYTASPVYHYTDAAGLLGMVKDHKLWATEASGMNDPLEGEYGRERLAAYVPPSTFQDEFEIRRGDTEGISGEEVFVACATTLDDDVSQWTRYTPWPNAGYVVGLDPTVQLGVLRSDEPARMDLTSEDRWDLGIYSRTSPWSRVAYGASGFKRALDTYHPWAENRLTDARSSATTSEEHDELKQIAEFDVVTALNDMTRLSKHAGFEAEREIRLVATIEKERGLAKYRPSRYGVVRYIELGAGARDQGFVVRDPEDTSSWQRLPIVSVTIAPSPFADRGLGAVRRLLEENGHDVTPTLSECSMR